MILYVMNAAWDTVAVYTFLSLMVCNIKGYIPSFYINHSLWHKDVFKPTIDMVLLCLLMSK